MKSRLFKALASLPEKWNKRAFDKIEADYAYQTSPAARDKVLPLAKLIVRHGELLGMTLTAPEEQLPAIRQQIDDVELEINRLKKQMPERDRLALEIAVDDLNKPQSQDQFEVENAGFTVLPPKRGSGED